MTLKKIVSMLAILSMALVTGCASDEVSTAEYSEPRQKVEAAQQLGANELPQASLHLRLAKEQLQAADALIEEGEEEEARYALMRAEADAELALALAKEDRMRGEVEEVVKQINHLRSDAR